MLHASYQLKKRIDTDGLQFADANDQLPANARISGRLGGLFRRHMPFIRKHALAEGRQEREAINIRELECFRLQLPADMALADVLDWYGYGEKLDINRVARNCDHEPLYIATVGKRPRIGKVEYGSFIEIGCFVDRHSFVSNSIVIGNSKIENSMVSNSIIDRWELYECEIVGRELNENTVLEINGGKTSRRVLERTELY